jgi:hypothetical protein
MSDAFDALSLDERLDYGLPRLAFAIGCEAAVRRGADRDGVLRWALTRLGVLEVASALVAAVGKDYLRFALHATAGALYLEASTVHPDSNRAARLAVVPARAPRPAPSGYGPAVTFVSPKGNA